MTARILDKRLRALAIEYAAADRAYRKASATADRPSGYQASPAEESARQRWRRACLAMAKAKAESMVGIAIKLRVIREDFGAARPSFSHAILRSALRDAERLAKRQG